MIPTLQNALEFIAGERDQPTPMLAAIPRWVLRTITWSVAIVLIYAFCGQSSKFIYIDF